MSHYEIPLCRTSFGQTAKISGPHQHLILRPWLTLKWTRIVFILKYCNCFNSVWNTLFYFFIFFNQLQSYRVAQSLCGLVDTESKKKRISGFELFDGFSALFYPSLWRAALINHSYNHKFSFLNGLVLPLDAKSKIHLFTLQRCVHAWNFPMWTVACNVSICSVIPAVDFILSVPIK